MESIFLTEFLLISNIETVIFLCLLIISFTMIHYLYKKKNIEFTKIIISATLMGLILGVIIQGVAKFPQNPDEIVFIKEVSTWYNLIGKGYMHLVQMIVAPLILISILNVVVGVSNSQGVTIKKLVSKTLQVTLSMTAISVIVGLFIGNFFKVGSLTTSTIEIENNIREVTPIATTFLELIPSNIMEAMVNNNVIGIVIFAGILGLAIWWVNHEDKEMGQGLYTGIKSLHKAIVNMALLILDYMPYAIIALLATTIASKGVTAIIEVGRFILIIYLAMFIQFTLQMLLLKAHGFSVRRFLKNGASILLMAFTTRSSMTCLPLTIQNLKEKMGVEESTASFVASFGTTAGMQGCAGVFPALLITYVSNITGNPLDISSMIMAVIVITVGSLGIAGIPGTATIAASVTFSGMGMMEQFPLISSVLAIDPIVDMGRTALNVNGAMVNAIVVSKQLENKK